MLRYLNAGESHGPRLSAILEGLPSGISLDLSILNNELKRRQQGHGRGGRMKIEQDCCEITAGLRFGKTLGSPLCLNITNRDWKNWLERMSREPIAEKEAWRVTRPRPGHADLPGALKYDHRDMRNILERSSARETAIRVAIGAVCKQFLAEFGITIASQVTMIGGITSPGYYQKDLSKTDLETWLNEVDGSPVRCPHQQESQQMVAKIDQAIAQNDSLGGVFEVIVRGVTPGLGSHVHWDRKLDAQLSGAFMSIQAIKGVEIGAGFLYGEKLGSTVHDEIFYKNQEFYHLTNNAGGIEGGISNGNDILIRAVMKPIPTLRRSLASVDIDSKEPSAAAYERSDVCAVPAAAVIGEAVAAYVIAQSFLEKHGGDSLLETKRNFETYKQQLRAY